LCASSFGACESFILASKYYLDFAAAGTGDNSSSDAALPSSRGPAFAVQYCLGETLMSTYWKQCRCSVLHGELKEEIISHCFRKAGVVYAEDNITESEVLDDTETENWKLLCEKLDVPTSVNLTDYVNVDCDVIVQKEITDEILAAGVGKKCTAIVINNKHRCNTHNSTFRLGRYYYGDKSG
jgi:hypothetical protein